MMKAICDTCKREYEELDRENFIYIEAGCAMLCYNCEKMMNKQFLDRINHQPERSKREDSVLNDIPEYGSQSSLNLDEWQRRCGALNTVETQ